MKIDGTRFSKQKIKADFTAKFVFFTFVKNTIPIKNTVKTGAYFFNTEVIIITNSS